MAQEPAASNAVPDAAAASVPRAAPGERAASGPASIVVQRHIEWSDTDASGAYHNTAVPRLMEAAETALMDRLGFLDDVYGRLPRAHLEVDFLRPLWHRDMVDVALRVAAVGRTSITYEVEVRRGDELCARGRSVAVLLDRAGGTPVPWPDEYRRLLDSSGPQRPERLTVE